MDNMREKTKELTKRKMTFVREYLKDFNGTQAAIRAGYSDGPGIRVQASRLLADDNIQKALASEGQKAAEQADITPEWVLSQLKELATTATTESVKAQAVIALGKYCALFVDTHVNVNGNSLGEIPSDRLQELLKEAEAKGAIPIRNIA